jgi:4-amino-4-deoxy-L-arabinose transferase-like glycosyltransferase
VTAEESRAGPAARPQGARPIGGEPGRPQPVGPVPVTVWALVVLQLLLGLGWSVLAPTYRAPDEPQHVDLALALAGGEPYPEPWGREVGTLVTETARRANLSADGTPVPDRGVRFAAADAPPRTDRPSFAAFAPDEPTGLGNQMPQHPPLYYLLAGWVLRGLPHATAFDVQIWLVRVLGSALVAPVPLLVWLTARRVTRDRSVALAAAALPVAVPQLAHVAGSVSNDGLLVLTVTAAIACGAAVLAGDLRLRTAVALGITSAAGLLTKAFALTTLPWITVVYGLAAWRRRRTGAPLRPALVPGAVAASVALAGGGWWYVRNVVRYGTPQPEAFPFADLVDLPAEPVIDLGYWVPYALSRFVLRFWGQLGWVEVALPWPLVWALFLVVAAGVAVALLRSAVDRPVALALLVPLAGIAAIVLPGALTLYLETGVPAGVQGRYLHPALAGLAVVAAAGWCTVAGRLRRWVPLAVVTTATVVQVLAALLALEHWYGPEASPGVLLAGRGLVAWSPVPPQLVLGVAAATAAAALVAVVASGVAGWHLPRLPSPDHRGSGGRERLDDRAR